MGLFYNDLARWLWNDYLQCRTSTCDELNSQDDKRYDEQYMYQISYRRSSKAITKCPKYQ